MVEHPVPVLVSSSWLRRVLVLTSTLGAAAEKKDFLAE